MTIFLAILAALSAFLGFAILSMSKSAFHEMEALLAFVIFVIAVGCAGIIEAVKALRISLEKTAAQPPPSICDGCSAVFTGVGATVQVGGEQKRVCPTCAQALIEDAKSGAIHG